MRVRSSERERAEQQDRAGSLTRVSGRGLSAQREPGWAQWDPNLAPGPGHRTPRPGASAGPPGHTPWPGSGLVAVLGALIVQRFLMYTAPAVAALGPTPGSRFPVSLLYTSAAALQRVQFLAVK